MIQLLFIVCTVVFSQEADHILLTRVVTQPNLAESISIYNPSDTIIDLTNYYICDNEDYYRMQTDDDNLSPSLAINGFTAKFPSMLINPGETLDIIFSENYQEFYGEGFIPDLIMYGSNSNSMLETEDGSFGSGINKIEESSELIILFYWDGNNDSIIKDVDYFLWGESQEPINKTGTPFYNNDTSPANQLYVEQEAQEGYAYSRIGSNENGETDAEGNGITGHDETSENFRESWEIIFLLSFENIINGNYECGIESRDACENGGPSSDAVDAECLLAEVEGIIVDFGNYVDAQGPYAFTIEDKQGYRLELTIWPNTWDILLDENYSILSAPPFFDFNIKATGNIYVYNNKKQIYVCGPNSIEIVQSYNASGVFIPSESIKTSINPVPYILIPSLNENLNFTYTFPDHSRVIIRILDLSGRFITTLEDKYFDKAGTVIRNNTELNAFDESINMSAWDGRDLLGQIVPPGTYIMHIEAMNPVTGETTMDAAPVVIGVKN